MTSFVETPRPLPRVGLLLGLHVVVWIGLVRVIPGDDFQPYPELGTLETPWVRQYVVALLAVLMLQIAFLRWSGWTREVLRDEPRRGGPASWIAPSLFALVAASVLVSGGVNDAPRAYWIGMTATMLLVGLTEEVTFRGIVLVGARRAFSREWVAVLISSATFGLFHLPNTILGQDLGSSIVQVVVTGIIGTALHLLRRASGRLWPCVLLHAAYDWVLIQGALT